MSSLLGIKLTPANQKKLDEQTGKSVMRIKRQLGMERGRIKGKRMKNKITDAEMRKEIEAIYKMKSILLKNIGRSSR
ncbi:MAG: hypothetical protein HOK30_01295 [Rhodospirillaceae bacterium]|nr:hypothetical protein [Rhodospirillaceae bacterium]